LKGGEEFLVVVPADVRPKVNSNIQIEFDTKYLHIFEGESGINISYQQPAGITA
jgi:hypothetical protein